MANICQRCLIGQNHISVYMLVLVDLYLIKVNYVDKTRIGYISVNVNLIIVIVSDHIYVYLMTCLSYDHKIIRLDLGYICVVIC